MSHIISIKTKVTDPAALSAACNRLGLAEPVQGTATHGGIHLWAAACSWGVVRPLRR